MIKSFAHLVLWPLIVFAQPGFKFSRCVLIRVCVVIYEFCPTQGCHSISISKFPDFSLTFNHFPDPFGRSILAIFIHRLFEDFAQIFELADLIFKEKSLTINVRKGMLLNINCLQFMFRNIPFLILLANYGN